MEAKESEEFQCFVCLDLIYKPIVLECGHISCFWCVHRAMSGFQDSSCAICRQPYRYFPGICQLLHHLILKIEPLAYKLREAEVLEEEKRLDCFSPQFIEYSVNGNHETSYNIVNSEALKEKEVTLSDVLCCRCGELLFRPAVLNCGHVFCEPCLAGLASEKITCTTCGSMHPGCLPKTCLDLDQFVEKRFPAEYAQRKYAFESRQIKIQNGCSSSSAAPSDAVSKKKMLQIPAAHGFMFIDEEALFVHVGVGCDACGMSPITGKRYKCEDCKERIGFDLCQACYDTPCKKPGRFNQQHTPDHKFKLENSSLLANILKEQIEIELFQPDHDGVDEELNE